MSTTNSTEVGEEELDSEYDPEDFGFIIGPDGKLKTLVIPEELMQDPPKEVLEILKIFGIDNFYDLENQTLH